MWFFFFSQIATKTRIFSHLAFIIGIKPNTLFSNKQIIRTFSHTKTFFFFNLLEVLTS